MFIVSRHSLPERLTRLAYRWAIGDRFFPYRFDARFAGMWLPFGALPGRDGVTLGEDRFRATFGLLNLETPLVHFRQRVPRVIGFRPHSALAVTVADCEGLVEAIGEELPWPWPPALATIAAPLTAVADGP